MPLNISFKLGNSDEDLLKNMASDVEYKYNEDELMKALDKAKLVQKEVEVRGKNGQVHKRKQWVKAGDEQSSDKTPVKQEDEEKQHWTKVGTSDEAKKQICDMLNSGKSRTDLMDEFKAQGVTWKESEHEGINWMRATMAMNKHLTSNTSQKDDTKTSGQTTLGADGKAIKFDRKHSTFKYSGSYSGSLMEWANQSSACIQKIGEKTIAAIKSGKLTTEKEVREALEYGSHQIFGSGFHDVTVNRAYHDDLYNTDASRELRTQMQYWKDKAAAELSDKGDNKSDKKTKQTTSAGDTKKTEFKPMSKVEKAACTKKCAQAILQDHLTWSGSHHRIDDNTRNTFSTSDATYHQYQKDHGQFVSYKDQSDEYAKADLKQSQQIYEDAKKQAQQDWDNMVKEVDLHEPAKDKYGKIQLDNSSSDSIVNDAANTLLYSHIDWSNSLESEPSKDHDNVLGLILQATKGDRAKADSLYKQAADLVDQKWSKMKAKITGEKPVQTKQESKPATHPGKKLSKDEAKAKTKSFTDKVNKDVKSRSDFMSKAKDQGISWKENDNPNINWMRCCMAMNKHFAEGGVFDINTAATLSSKELRGKSVDKLKKLYKDDSISKDSKKKILSELNSRGVYYDSNKGRFYSKGGGR